MKRTKVNGSAIATTKRATILTNISMSSPKISINLGNLYVNNES